MNPYIVLSFILPLSFVDPVCPSSRSVGRTEAEERDAWERRSQLMHGWLENGQRHHDQENKSFRDT